MQRRRYLNRAAARSAVRNATVRRSLARGRVPGNVAGVERRGVGERQGLEIKKCKFARVFMATISLMVVCCEIFSIEENWGKRRGEGTPPYGWGRVRCGFLMCGTAGRVAWSGDHALQGVLMLAANYKMICRERFWPFRNL